LKKIDFDAQAPEAETVLARGRDVIRFEASALSTLADSLGESFVAACDLLFQCRQRVIVTGMGKSGHVGRKITATLAATGTPAQFIHPAEAAHGDLGMIMPGDVLMAISNSGNTAEMRPILEHAHRMGIAVIGIASRMNSLVMKYARVPLCLPVAREACAINVAPTTSTTMQMALGDALALAVMDMRGVDRDGLKALHPAGSIGLRLTPVAEIMHGPDERPLPLVRRDASMADVIAAMTDGTFGIAGVIESDGRLCGVITDGDLRRKFERLGGATAEQVMTESPRTVAATTMAEDALLFLNTHKITAAFVLDCEIPSLLARPIGVVHLHDFLRFGLN